MNALPVYHIERAPALSSDLCLTRRPGYVILLRYMQRNESFHVSTGVGTIEC